MTLIEYYPATKMLIGEFYQATFEHLDYLKKTNQDEYRRLIQKLTEIQDPISVKAKEAYEGEENAFEDLELEFREKLEALFTEEETSAHP